MWPTPDGMVEGHFKVTPEVGGAIEAVIDHGTRKQFRAARKSGVHESQDRYAADAFADAIVGDPDTATRRRAAAGRRTYWSTMRRWSAATRWMVRRARSPASDR